MAERRDKQPEPGTRPALIASGTNLSPVQRAWGAYTDHATHCDTCRSLDAGSCDTAETLYRAYRATEDDAYRQVHGEPI